VPFGSLGSLLVEAAEEAAGFNKAVWGGLNSGERVGAAESGAAGAAGASALERRGDSRQ